MSMFFEVILLHQKVHQSLGRPSSIKCSTTTNLLQFGNEWPEKLRFDNLLNVEF